MTSEGPDPTPRSETSEATWQFTYDSSRIPYKKPVLLRNRKLRLLVPFNSRSAVSPFFLSIYHSIYAFFKLLAGYHMRTPYQE